MASDYDKGKVTDREKLASKRQNALAEYNARSVKANLTNQLRNYDLADKQNKLLRDTELRQARRKNETDRFEAQRNLQNAALGLFGSMNQAMNGSAIGNAMKMLADRNDAENNIYWQQLEDNSNQVNNAYQESLNQNQAARYEAAVAARNSLRDIQSDLAANLNNINPNLYASPGSNDAISKLETELMNKQHSIKEKNAALSGYTMPANSEAKAQNDTKTRYGRRNKLLGNDYYDNLINRFNRR